MVQEAGAAALPPATPLLRSFGLLWLLFAMVTLIVFWPWREVYFWQDDFISLAEVHFAPLATALHAFLPWSTGPLKFYRPLTTELYFAIGDTLFGLNPVLYHYSNFLLHAANAALVYVLAREVALTRSVAFAVSVVFLTSRIGFESLIWISGVQELGLTCGSLICVIAYLRAARRPSHRPVALVAVSFAAALLSKEPALALPGVLLAYEIIHGFRRPSWADTWKPALNTHAVLWVIAGLYLAFRLVPNLTQLTNHDGESIFDFESSLASKYLWGIRWSSEAFFVALPLLKSTFCPSCRLSSMFVPGLVFFTILTILWLTRHQSTHKRVSKRQLSSLLTAAWGLSWFVVAFAPAALVNSFAAYLFMVPSIGLYLAMGGVLQYFSLSLFSSERALQYANVAAGALSVYALVGAFVVVHAPYTQAAFIQGTDATLATLTALERTCPQMTPGTTVTLVGFPESVWSDARHAEAAFRRIYNEPRILENRVSALPEHLPEGPILNWTDDGGVEVIAGCRNGNQ